MPETVICDTSPIFYLYRLRQLDLLKRLQGVIVVPQPVIDELEQGGAEGEDVPELATYPWIQVKSVCIPRVITLVTDLGPGEASGLTLALELPDVLVILDDLLARRIAELQGLRITGTAGVLLKAKQQGYVEAIAPIIQQLVNLGFRISNRLQQDILRLAGESHD
ncbi:uncharacterized protein HKBW3S43_01858 [Candidatus Hakubella thermalkaliphila]|uniref:DUF3368 domain-containing protein n=1 Tax=Candidatus Hakubella thermalkaliphila TaxID=2754717 RepID=A0A6V8NZ16_9ACTN|nr:DUF3368 domain-containing protein [Candidatus Hakubella thermalkaliphila]GFP25263.1 uncharacterized protein HKBW3S25_00721 [Candidatus Hakubella thermalkaliphila]GFP36071.1 uncharacterized protein HKBW3S43_01858 [Candidatus Hakubella thermalkaliphila]